MTGMAQLPPNLIALVYHRDYAEVGAFYDMQNAIFEKSPLNDTALNEKQLAIKSILQQNLDEYPNLPEATSVKIKKYYLNIEIYLACLFLFTFV